MHRGTGHWWRRPRLRTKLALLAATATAAVLAGTVFLAVTFFRSQLLRTASEASSTESDVLRAVLEEQMIAGDRSLLRRAISDIGREPNISWVGVVDAVGEVRVATDPASVGVRFLKSAPDCQICHQHEAAQRARSVTLVRPGAGVLRTVTPLVNKEVCHQCHDPKQRINGVLIVDRTLGSLERAVLSGRDQIVAGSVAALVVLLVSLGIGLEKVVLSRLRRLRLVARELGRGNLAARAERDSDDEIGNLAHDINVMAGRLAAAMTSITAERRQLDELVNGIGDGIILVDTHLRVVTANRAFAARLQHGVPPRRGAGYRELMGGLDFPGAQSPAERAAVTGALEKEIIRVGRDGEERVEEVYAQPLRGDDGSIVAVIEVWRDITDRISLEADLEHSERLATLGMMATGIAHEVGNPLASIATAVEGLLKRMADPGGAQVDDIREYLEIVRKQVFRCHAVTERLLGFARLPSRDVVPIDAAAVAREVLRLVAPQARAQKVAIRTSLGEPALAMAEDLLLHQVFLNLVLNALRVMPAGGELRVEARVEADAVRILVADTGPGIPDHVLRHLFEPLRSPGAHGGGTGLGLFLSHTLVRHVGGSIGAESRTGAGATFTVRLQRAHAADGAAATAGA